MPVSVQPHDPAWADTFRSEAERLQVVFGDHAALIEHIGSTSIAGILAKPVIDILIGVDRLEIAEALSPQMLELGYEAMGAYGLAGRCYFRKSDSEGVRTHHVHVYQADGPDILRHLAFRDFLLAHPTKAAAYSALKAELAARPGMTGKSYQTLKADFIGQVESEAQVWAAIKASPGASAKPA